MSKNCIKCVVKERTQADMLCDSCRDQKDAEEKAKLDRFIGMRVVMSGNHPWEGEHGTVARNEKTPFGVRPVIKLDNGEECFAIRPENIRRL